MTDNKKNQLKELVQKVYDRFFKNTDRPWLRYGNFYENGHGITIHHDCIEFHIGFDVTIKAVYWEIDHSDDFKIINLNYKEGLDEELFRLTGKVILDVIGYELESLLNPARSVNEHG